MERTRQAGVNGDETHFVVRRDEDNEVVVAACTKDGTSFVLSLDAEDFTMQSDSFLAHMTSNFAGTGAWVGGGGGGGGGGDRGEVINHSSGGTHCHTLYTL